MAQNSGISWCDHTFNPWRGCVEVSEGCAHCYARDFSERNPEVLGEWGAGKLRALASESYWNWLPKWNRWAELGTCYVCAGTGKKKAKKGQPEASCETCDGAGNVGPYRARVFVASMADVFENREDLIEPRKRLFDAVPNLPHLDFMFLTKRSENVGLLMPNDWRHNGWPKNLWLGASVENRKRAYRVDHLQALSPAPFVRFLSCEPLLSDLGDLDLTGIDLVVAGGESGPDARPAHPHWAYNLRDLCVRQGVLFHWKQWGTWLPVCETTDADDGMLYYPAPARDPEATRKPRVAQTVLQLNGKTSSDFPQGTGAMLMFAVGKHKAGRLLGGKIWDQMPEGAR
jgi:protein gp37